MTAQPRRLEKLFFLQPKKQSKAEQFVLCMVIYNPDNYTNVSVVFVFYGASADYFVCPAGDRQSLTGVKRSHSSTLSTSDSAWDMPINLCRSEARETKDIQK